MPDPTTLGVFALASLVFFVVPGPSVIYIVSLGESLRRKISRASTTQGSSGRDDRPMHAWSHGKVAQAWGPPERSVIDAGTVEEIYISPKARRP